MAFRGGGGLNSAADAAGPAGIGTLPGAVTLGSAFIGTGAWPGCASAAGSCFTAAT